MNEVTVIEDGCCHAGELNEFVQFLTERLEGRATVRLYGVGGRLGFSEVPAELTKGLLEQGANTIPVVALDGKLVHQGELPDWEDCLRLLEERMAAEVVTERA